MGSAFCLMTFKQTLLSVFKDSNLTEVLETLGPGLNPCSIPHYFIRVMDQVLSHAALIVSLL